MFDSRCRVRSTSGVAATGVVDSPRLKEPPISAIRKPIALPASSRRTIKPSPVNLTNPDAAFLVNLCNFSGLGIMPEHVLKDVAPDQLQKHSFALAPTVTAGAFKFVKYQTDQYLELARNDTYWGDPPALDSIFLQILTSDVALAQLQTGKIDIMTLAVQDTDKVKTLSNAQLMSVASPSMDFLAVNVQRDYSEGQAHTPGDDVCNRPRGHS